MASRRETLERQRAKIQAELNAIEQRENAKIAKTKIGKCFKYRNSYSCPEGPEDYWWLYFYITHVEDGYAMAIRFQVDKHGRIIIERDGLFPMSLNFTEYREIPLSELRDAWRMMLRDIGDRGALFAEQ